MSPAPIAPQPDVAPSQGPQANWSFAGSGTSGTHQASGLSCATGFTTDWYISTQTLLLEYIRIPFFGGGTGITNLGLSGTPVVNYIIPSTRLMARATATVNVVKELGTCYDTSSWSQGQKFTILGASADHNGSGYGSESDFDASTLGPAGSVNTYQAGYFRRAWVSTDKQSSATVTAYNTCNYTINCNGISYLSSENEQWNGSEDYFIWLGPQSQKKYSLLETDWGVSKRTFTCASPSYGIPGQYMYSKESMYGLLSFVDGIGQALGNTAMHPDTPNANYGNYGLMTYNWKLHDWS